MGIVNTYMKLQEILLNELTGVKKFYTKTLYQMLLEIASELRCEVYSGSFAYVLTREDWDHVYKVWYKDPPYEKYVDWMLKHQKDPHVPKVKKRLVKLDSFNLRPDEESYDTIKVLKTEKLRGITVSNKNWDEINYLYCNWKLVQRIVATLNDSDSKKELPIDSLSHQHLFGYAEDFDGYVTLNELFKKFPEAEDYFYTLADFARELKAGDTLDVHNSNVMLRDSDGKLVITDPAYDSDWLGQSEKFRHGWKQISGRSKSSKSEVLQTTADVKKASNAIAF